MLPEPFSNVGAVVESLATSNPDGPALRAEGRTFRRGEIAARARALAAGWRAAGFAPGEVVGILGEGGPAFALAFFSSAAAGLFPLLLDPRTSAEEARTVFARARPRAIALCGIPAGPFEGGLPTFSFDAEGCGALPSPSKEVETRRSPESPAVLLVTSGTSGHPRIVALTSRNLFSNMAAGYEVLPCGPTDVFLSVLPVTHAFEFTAGFLGPLACGASVVYPGSRNPNRLLAFALSEGVTQVRVVPSILRMMEEEIRDVETGREILRGLRGRLKSIVCGGAPTSPELVARVVRRRMPLWLGYGLTEAAPIVALGRADSLPRGSTGRALPGVDVRIEEGTGEVFVRGPNVMAAYVGDPEATAGALRDGWLRTGDVGRLDEEGRLFLHGRRREMIVTGAGEKLFPDEVEAAYRSPLFAEVCVVGLPDPQGGGGEKPHVAIVPAAAGEERLLREEFVRLSRAAGRRRAQGMTVLLTPLPRTRNLKVRRDLVKEEVLRREGSRP